MLLWSLQHWSCWPPRELKSTAPAHMGARRFAAALFSYPFTPLNSHDTTFTADTCPLVFGRLQRMRCSRWGDRNPSLGRGHRAHSGGHRRHAQRNRPGQGALSGDFAKWYGIRQLVRAQRTGRISVERRCAMLDPRLAKNQGWRQGQADMPQRYCLWRTWCGSCSSTECNTDV